MKPPAIRTNESLREVLAADFAKDVPIRGGWGYSVAEAVIIDKNDPTVPRGLPFDGVGLEYFIVEKRIYEELIVFRDEGDRFSGIEWKLLSQRVLDHCNRTYDHLVFEVTALRDSDWAELKVEWEGAEGCRSPTFDRQAHLAERERRKIRYEAEFWFDISSFL
jgi:hypothetical protein